LSGQLAAGEFVRGVLSVSAVQILAEADEKYGQGQQHNTQIEQGHSFLLVRVVKTEGIWLWARVWTLCSPRGANTTTYLYDGNGNQTSVKIGVAPATLYTWGPRDQLASLSTGAAFEYDSAGHRTAKTSGGNRTLYVWSGDQMMAETNTIGNSLSQVSRVGSLLLGEVRNGVAQHFAQDAFNSVIVTTLADGTVPGRLSYRAFGQVRSLTGNVETPFRFNGYLSDGGDELSSPSRYYSVANGRFTSMDPAKMDPMNPITGNPFVGMNGNPMIYIDINGRVGWLTDVKNFFDGNVEHYQGMAAAPGATRGDGVLAGLGMGLSEIGSGAFRGLNYLSNVSADYAGRAAPGTFGGVQEQAQEDLEGTFQSAEAMGTAAANPGQTHERAVATVVAAMEGDPQATMMLTSTAVGLAAIPMGRVAAPTVFTRGNQVANTVARPVKYFTAATIDRVTTVAARAGSTAARGRALSSEMNRALQAGEVDAAAGARAASDGPHRVQEGSGPEPVLCANGSCFVAGTPVLTAEGLKPIETVQTGELVAARNELTGATTWQRVETVFITLDREVWNLSFVDDAGKIEVITATPNHPFALASGGWQEAAKLLPGDQIATLDGRVIRLLTSQMDANSATTYNLMVAKDSTYFVGNAGLWVHNQDACCPKAGELAVPDTINGKGGRRSTYMGGTPDKFSRTGREVLERMRADGLIQGEGDLLRGNPNSLQVRKADGTFSPIDSNIDMAHLTDAVSWWNNVGRTLGAKSSEVRQFMLDSKNYEFQPRSINRSDGAKLKQTYQPPLTVNPIKKNTDQL